MLCTQCFLYYKYYTAFHQQKTLKNLGHTYFLLFSVINVKHISQFHTISMDTYNFYKQYTLISANKCTGKSFRLYPQTSKRAILSDGSSFTENFCAVVRSGHNMSHNKFAVGLSCMGRPTSAQVRQTDSSFPNDLAWCSTRRQFLWKSRRRLSLADTVHDSHP